MFEYSDGYGHGPGVGPGVELDRERKNATFDVTAMTNLIYGGPEVTLTLNPTPTPRPSALTSPTIATCVSPLSRR